MPDSNTPRPRLAAVEPPEDRAPASAPAPEGSPPGQRAVPVLAALLALCLLALAVQTWRGGTLASQVEGLRVELGAAQAALAAQEARISEARGQVGTVREQVGGVRESMAGLEARLTQLEALLQ